MQPTNPTEPTNGNQNIDSVDVSAEKVNRNEPGTPERNKVQQLLAAEDEGKS